MPEMVENDAALRSACGRVGEARALLVTLRSRVAEQKELKEKHKKELKELKEEEKEEKKELKELQKELKEDVKVKEVKLKQKLLRSRQKESVQKLLELAEQLREPMEDARHCEARHFESLAREEMLCGLQAVELSESEAIGLQSWKCLAKRLRSCAPADLEEELKRLLDGLLEGEEVPLGGPEELSLLNEEVKLQQDVQLL